MKDYLRSIEIRYHDPKYIQTDPIKFVYRFQSPYEIELIAFLVSLFAYGNVVAMMNFLELFLQFLGSNPTERILSFKENTSFPYHYRFQTRKDIKTTILFIKELLERKDKFAFVNLWKYSNVDENIYDPIDRFRKEVLSLIPKKYITDGIRHLFCLSEHMTVAKRYCLFFRWMVRRDFPDFGIYDFIPPKKLIFPLDIHILNFSYQNRIIENPFVSRKNAIAITKFFEKFSPEDPVKYDFYITREILSKKFFK
ncbi:MAG: TIGR02757 family protein [Leptospiraceae bacterium]|nr:TIGR02757 family protein [Leptospiraceae bacterium]MDW7976374.1 TIGR02757 family protein [Leptospiraceae bacterium]